MGGGPLVLFPQAEKQAAVEKFISVETFKTRCSPKITSPGSNSEMVGEAPKVKLDPMSKNHKKIIFFSECTFFLRYSYSCIM